MTADRRRLDSLTKYPSIPTWHVLDGKGVLTDEPTKVADDVALHLTEKVDGTNSRVIVLDERWWIGSRDNLVAASDGSIPEPANPLERTIIDALKPVATRHGPTPHVVVLYFEVYGAKIGASAKTYSTSSVSRALFDRAEIRDSAEILASWEPERIAGWRKRGGQRFSTIFELETAGGALGETTVPKVGAVFGAAMPKTLEAGLEFLNLRIPRTRCALDAGARGRPEGLVARTAARSVIAKLRLEDYERALRKRATRGGP